MKSRKSGKKVSAGWSLIRQCACCGKFVVLLKLPAYGSKTDPRWYRACYLKGWDGNPWYSTGSAYPHARGPLAEHFETIRVPEEEIDPFFSLDTI